MLACDFCEIQTQKLWITSSHDVFISNRLTTSLVDNRLLNKCVKRYSCGGQDPYWTDAKMPDKVGEIKRVNVYGSHSSDGVFNCTVHSKPLQVMRCSWDTNHDFIYKFIGYYYTFCNDTFCGMKA